MLNKLRTVRFTIKDLLIATLQCSVGLALLVLGTNPRIESGLPKTIYAIVGCVLFCRGIFRPLGGLHGRIGIIVLVAVSLVLLLLMSHRS
jgi:hypothetical protein